MPVGTLFSMLALILWVVAHHVEWCKASQTVKWLLRLWINTQFYKQCRSLCDWFVNACLSVSVFIVLYYPSPLCFNQSALILMIEEVNLEFHLHLPSSAGLVSDFSLTNSLATSSVERWERIRSAVVPVSSMLIRGPKGHQHTQLFRSVTSRSCSTAIPTTRSTRPKQ